MEIKLLEVFSETLNFAIVRLPGRKFPGCVIQGDSLSILVADLESICVRLKNGANKDVVADAESVRDDLRSRLDHYESVLKKHKTPLPYFRES